MFCFCLRPCLNLEQNKELKQKEFHRKYFINQSCLFKTTKIKMIRMAINVIKYALHHSSTFHLQSTQQCRFYSFNFHILMSPGIGCVASTDPLFGQKRCSDQIIILANEIIRRLSNVNHRRVEKKEIMEVV